MPKPTATTAPMALLAERLDARREELADRMIARYRSEIPDYRLAGEEVVADVRAVSLENIDVLVAALRSDREAGPDDFSSTRARATRRPRQGIALESFLRAARQWGEVLWEEVLDVADAADPGEREAALAIAGRVIRHIDLLSMHAAEGYLAEAQGMWADRAVVRRDLLDGLVAGQGESERVQRLARSLGLRLGEAYVVVIARPGRAPAGEPDAPETDPALRPLVDAAREHLGAGGAAPLVGMRHGEVVALCPGGLDEIKAGAAALARALEPEGACVGAGGAHPGLTEIATSYAEAREAADIATGTGTVGRAVHFDDVLIDHMVRSSPHADRILDGSLRPLLEYDEARQADLVGTLREYVASGFNLARSAERLCVHANTVAYRLRRIHELCGRDPHDPDDLLLLVLGLRLVDLRARG